MRVNASFNMNDGNVIHLIELLVDVDVFYFCHLFAHLMFIYNGQSQKQKQSLFLYFKHKNFCI